MNKKQLENVIRYAKNITLADSLKLMVVPEKGVAGNDLYSITVGTLLANMATTASVSSLLTYVTPTIGTPVNAVAASGILTISDTPVADETININGITYTLVAERSATGEITIDADNAVQVTNIIAAVTLDDDEITATDGTGDTVNIVYNTKGVIGNSAALTSDATGIAVNGEGYLFGGIDGTIGTIGERYISDDMTTKYTAMKDNTIADANWRKVTYSAL